MNPAHAAIARIDKALSRIEAAARKSSSTGLEVARYDALRARTQAALASLETVIAQVDSAGGTR